MRELNGVSGAAEAYTRWLLGRRYLILCALLSLAVTMGCGVGRLEFDASYRAYFGDANPQLQAFEEFQAVYSKTDNILMVLAPEGEDVFTPRVLGAVRRLTEAAWRIPMSRRVDSVTNFQHTRADGDNLTVGDLVPAGDVLSAPELARLRRIALGEPRLRGRLISPGGQVTGVNVTLSLTGARNDEVEAAVGYAARLLEALAGQYPDVRFYLTGGAVMDHAFPQATLHDIKTLIPVVFVVIVLAMAGSLRSLSGTVAVVAVMALASLTGMGMAGWLGIRLTPPSVGAATIIMTLAVADGVHILTTQAWNMRRGWGHQAALGESLRVNVQPVFLTSLTTAIGFLSMNFSDAPPFRDLGNITAMGVLAAFVYSMVLLPVLVTILPPRVARRSPGQEPMEALANWVVRRRRGLLWGMVAAVLGLGACIPRIELNDQFVEYFDESIRFRRDTDFVAHNLTGINLLEYSLDSGAPFAIGEPAYLRSLDAFAAWYAAQPETLHVSTITQVLKRLNMNLHGDAPAWYRLPASRELAAQYLLLYEMSLPYGLDLSDQVNVDKSATRFSVTVGNLSTREFRHLERRAQDWLLRHAPTLASPATGPAVMFAYISERNIRTMMIGSGLAIVLITLTLTVALRSVRFGLLSLVPNLVPAIMAFGVWGLTVGRVGLVVSVVFAMALGIIVDDTVHLLHNYLNARRARGATPVQALRYAFATVGTAMWVTSVVLVLGFSLLSLSAFRLNASTGQLTALMIGFALAADFFLLPPLLLALEARAARRGRRD